MGREIVGTYPPANKALPAFGSETDGKGAKREGERSGVPSSPPEPTLVVDLLPFRLCGGSLQLGATQPSFEAS